MAVSQTRKDGIIAMEYGGFLRAISSVKAFQIEQYNYKGSSCAIYRDTADGDGAQKATAARNAVQTIVDKGFGIPAGLRIYCTQAIEAQNRAFNKDPAWNDIAYITLGRGALVGGRPDATSAMIFPGFTKCHITCIHEIGHVLHAHARGDDFHDPTANLTGQAVNSGSVSGYAAQNKKEFVAEVFAGLMIGRVFPNSVVEEYMQYGGPH